MHRLHCGGLRQRVARIAFDRAGLLGVLVLALYLWLAPRHVVDGDNAEFSTLGALGGAAHPPGYPLYVLYLRAMSWLPGASPAHTAALATAILGAASIVVMHAACRAWGARPIAATVACGLLAAAPLAMTMYTEAEVFALNGVVVAAVLLIAAEHGPLRGAWRVFALGLAAGLGLADHQTCVLLAPVGLLGVVRGARESTWRAVAWAIVGLALGLTAYLYLLVAPVHAGSWGEIDGVGDVVGAFLRRDYGGPATFATKGQDVAWTTSLGALAYNIGRSWWWLPALAGLGAFGERIARGHRVPIGEPRAGWILLLASWLLAGPLLVLRFNVPPEGIGRYVVDRFHILPAVMLAIPVAIAFELAARARERRATTVPAWIPQVIAAVAFVAAAGTSLAHVAAVHVPAVELQAENTLRSLPPRSMVVGFDDDLGSAVHYLQLALGERPDVEYVQKTLLGLSWYRGRVAARGFALDGIVDSAFAQGRPVFAQTYAHDMIAAFPNYPYGILVRVLPRGEHPPPLAEVVAENRKLYEGFDLRYPRPSRADEIPAAIHGRYAATWKVLAHALDDTGHAAEAAAARELAAQLEPAP
jgi:hypothetical protein